MEVLNVLSCQRSTPHKEVCNGALEAKCSGTGTPSNIEEVELYNIIICMHANEQHEGGTAQGSFGYNCDIAYVWPEVWYTW